jgi:hypothetical protein
MQCAIIPYDSEVKMKILKIKQAYVGMPVYYRFYDALTGQMKKCHGIVLNVDKYKGSMLVHFCDGEHADFYEGGDLELHDLYATVTK